MGGIFGLLRLDGQAADRTDLERQQRSLAHLGPDGNQLLCDGPIGLGWLSLQLTHEDAFDAQPLCDPDTGVALVADLRLDNRAELAAALGIADVRLQGLPDSALLLDAYLRWGEHCAGRLLGDFVFAVWDPRARRLTLGRDHMGQRHVFFHHGDQFFAFASEMKGLWALPDIPRALCEPALAASFLRLPHRRGGQTKFQSISGLPGATVMTVDADGSTRQWRYWTPRPAPEHLGRDEAYYPEAYRAVLGEAVACRVRRTTRPCGLLLSGGFDSAAIAAMARPPAGRLIAAASTLEDPGASGPMSARRWVDLCGRDMPHLDVRYVTRQGRSIFSGLERAFVAGDGQMSVNRYVNDELYAAVAAAGARVVMDGFGGDYTLNPRGHFPVARLLATGRLADFMSELRARRRVTGVSWLRCVWREVVLPFAPETVRRAIRRIRAGEPLFDSEDPIESGFAREAAAWSEDNAPKSSVRDPGAVRMRLLERLQDQPYLGGFLPGAHGLVLTEPFHDKRVVELALAIPEDMHFRNGHDRRLARTALSDLLPPEFQTRSSANIPLIPDLRRMALENEARMLEEIERLGRNPRLTRYFDFDKMRRTLRRELRRDPRRRRGSGLRQAMRGLLLALQIEWFLGGNAPDAS